MIVTPDISTLGIFYNKQIENNKQLPNDIKIIIKNAQISLVIENANTFDYSLFIFEKNNESSLNYSFKIKNELNFIKCINENDNNCLIWQENNIIYIFEFENNENKEKEDFFNRLNLYITSRFLKQDLKSINKPKNCVNDLGYINDLNLFINEDGFKPSNFDTTIEISNQCFPNLYQDSIEIFNAPGNFYKFNEKIFQTEQIISDGIYKIYQNKDKYFISVEKDNLIKKKFTLSKNLDIKKNEKSNFIIINDKSKINLKIYSFYFKVKVDFTKMNVIFN